MKKPKRKGYVSSSNGITIATSAALPAMPSEPITLTLGAGIRMRLLHDFGRFSNGRMMMAITSAEVTNNGKKVGYVRGDCAAPNIEVCIYPDGDADKGRSWLLPADQIFAAVMAADEAYETESA